MFAIFPILQTEFFANGNYLRFLILFESLKGKSPLTWAFGYCKPTLGLELVSLRFLR